MAASADEASPKTPANTRGTAPAPEEPASLATEKSAPWVVVAPTFLFAPAPVPPDTPDTQPVSPASADLSAPPGIVIEERSPAAPPERSHHALGLELVPLRVAILQTLISDDEDGKLGSSLVLSYLWAPEKNFALELQGGVFWSLLELNSSPLSPLVRLALHWRPRLGPRGRVRLDLALGFDTIPIAPLPEFRPGLVWELANGDRLAFGFPNPLFLLAPLSPLSLFGGIPSLRYEITL